MAATLPLTKYRNCIRSSGRTNNSIRSGSGILENPQYLVLNLLLRPIRVLAAKKRRLVPAARPVKPMRRPPTLLRGHAPEDRELFGTRLLIRKHDGTVRRKTRPSKLFAFPVVVATEVTRFKFVSAFSISDFRFFRIDLSSV